MKRIITILFIFTLSLSFLVSCGKQDDNQQMQLYETYDDPALSDLFAPAPKGKALLSEEEFLNKTRNSSYIQYGDVIPYDKFVELVGKPQREVLYIGPSEVSYRQKAPFSRVRNLEWVLKNNKTLVYTVIIPDEYSDISTNSESIIKYGLVTGIGGWMVSSQTSV